MSYPNREELMRMGVAVFVVYLGIYYWGVLSQWLLLLLAALSPVLVGCIIAYIANIPMRFFEERLAWMGEHPWLAHVRRPVSLLAGFVIVTGLAVFLMWFIAPELVQSVRMMSYKVPALVRDLRAFFRELDLEELADAELSRFSNWDSIQQQVSSYLMSGAGGVMESVVGGITSVLTSTYELFLSLILALYILMSKEQLGSQVSTLIETYFGNRVRDNFAYVTGVLDHSFHSFIVGRCLASLLLGILCTAGMLLFRFPYAMTIGTVVGVTNIVPVVGPYVGGIIGALLIFSVSPFDAFLFVLFVLVLQQIDANVVFPRVMGSSTGLPGIWVLAAVAVGGGLGGIPFILLSVPVAASVYQLVSDDIHARGQATLRADELNE